MKKGRIAALILCLILVLLSLPLSAAEHSFTDVPAGAYYEEAVVWAVEKGITAGTSQAKFSPKMVCDRSQAVTFLWRAAGSPEPVNENMAFTDVKADAYYAKAVLWAVEEGITSGTGGNKFSPLMKCDRSQIVTFLWRAMGAPETAMTNPFADVKDDAYYLDAVLWAVDMGITSGTGGNNFSPKMSCDRSQIVTFLYRCFKEAPHEHSFGEWTVTTPAGCMTEGVETGACECGATETRAIAATGHSFGAWSVSVEPTYDDEGVEVAVCSACGEETTRAIPVIIPDPFEIKSQPVSVDADAGDTVEFVIVISGGKPSHSYQWQLKYADTDFEDIEGAVSYSYSLTLTEEHRSRGASFRCIATDALGQELVSDTVSVNYPVWFDYADVCVDIAPDTDHIINCEPKGGNAPYSYEWEVLDVAANEWVKASSLDIAELGTDGEASFNVKATGYVAEYYDSFRCKVTDAKGEYAYSPVVSLRLTALAFADDMPEAVTVSDVGEDIAFTIRLASDVAPAPLTYRIEYFSLKRNKWVRFREETSDSLVLEKIYLSKAEDRDYGGRYRVTVIDAEGNSITSKELQIKFN